jgi:endonuclease/exonuclease/phosphatase family metal-dependent hydrolase
MTRNLYLGAELMPVVLSPTVDDIPVQVAKVWDQIQASDPPGRLAAVAAAIASARPDIVGLQEVTLLRVQTPSNFSYEQPVIDATEVKFDFLELLQTALLARGLAYEAFVSEHTDIELPGGPAGSRYDLRLTDRNAILVRKGIAAKNYRAVRFATKLPFPIPLGGGSNVKVTLLRGVGIVEIQIGKAGFIFANTHLEPGGGPGGILTAVQEGQAANLLAELSATGSQVLVGDLNSPATGAETRSYGMVTSGGFIDAWPKASGDDAGLTCCTEDLRAATFTAARRIDFVFYRGPVETRAVTRVGVAPSERTPAGLWPSDHAGVVATLRL